MMMDSFHTHSYCRLCADLTTNLLIINIDAESANAIHQKLDRINASTNFNDDVLPRTLCRECAHSLEKAYDFVQQIEQAQSKLRSIFHAPSFKRETTEDKFEFRITIDDNVEVKEERETFVSSYSNAAVPDPINIKIDGFDDVKEELNNVDPNDVNILSVDHPNFEADDPDHDYGSEELHTEVTATAKTTKKIPKPKKTVKSKRAAKKETSNASSTEQSWKDFTWKCAICDIEFNSFDKLKTHTTQYHNICNAFRCVDCNIRKLRLDRFLVHVKRHRNYLRVICFKCNERFASAVHLNTHMASHRTGSQTIHTCPGCYTEFKNLTEFNKHTSEFYRESRRKPVTALVEKITDKLTCLLCNKTFRHRGNLNTHIQIHTKEEKIRNHTCERCGKCFATKVALDEHIRRHDNVRPFECKICNNSFITKKQLRMHIGVHDNAKPFACEQCGRCFRLRRQLTAHKIIHTDSLPYACTVCDKRFRFRSLLNQHNRQHTGVKPYSCDICQRDFTNWPNYNKHMKRRHNLDMAKKKHTPEGICPINPATGEVITYPQSKEVLEWKKEIMKRRVPQKRDPPVTDTTNPENVRLINELGEGAG